MNKFMKQTFNAFCLLTTLGFSQAEAKTDLKKQAALWYEAFDKHDPAILDKVLADDWYETPSKNRKIEIEAIGIHQFKDGKIIHTWHSEDWMTGLRQLGVFEK